MRPTEHAVMSVRSEYFATAKGTTINCTLQQCRSGNFGTKRCEPERRDPNPIHNSLRCQAQRDPN
jgi:hypothetical protein